MPQYVLNRNYVLATLKGHRIKFVKGEPTHVPPSCVPDVVAIGATPADGSEPEVIPVDLRGEPPAASDPDKRTAAIIDAMKKLVARNDPDDFGADNAPKVDAVRAMVGFKLDTKERNALWQTYHELLAAGEA